MTMPIDELHSHLAKAKQALNDIDLDETDYGELDLLSIILKYELLRPIETAMECRSTRRPGE